MKNRVLVIALDGVTFNVIRPLMQAGTLPNLTLLMAKGSSGELLSTMPPVSGPAWHAFKTGKSPGQTGLYDFLRYDPQAYRSSLIQLGQLPDSMVWNMVSQHCDYRVGVYDLPTTYPPAKVNGFMVAGFPLPENASDYTYPVELKTALDELTGGHQTDLRYRAYPRDEDFLEAVHGLLEQRVKVFHYLKTKYDPEFFIFAITCTDRVQHRLWKYIDPESRSRDPVSLGLRKLLDQFWRDLDAAVGEFLRTVGDETTVMVVSDHGFGSQDATFYVNQWLADRGYLKLRSERASLMPFIGQGRRIAKKLSSWFPVPYVLRHWGKSLLRQTFAGGTHFESFVHAIDWEHTKAYSPSHTSVFGTIYINLKGREGQGAVDPSAYHTVREEVARDLRSLKEMFPDLEVVVYKREELYQGPYLHRAPDLIYVINNFRCISRQVFAAGPVFKKQSLGMNYSGTHRLEGILMMKGPQIREGYWLGKAMINDVTPTLLHLLEAPIPKDMDGRVLKEAFKPGSPLAQKEIRYSEPLESGGPVAQGGLLDRTVRKQLEDLGYL